MDGTRLFGDGAAAVRQHTVARAVACAGIGLHSGAAVTMRVCPAAPGTGILFRRTDVTGPAALVTARWDAVVDTQLSTVLANAAGTRVGTVEHLMASILAGGIDNAVVELDAAELPAMDGSAMPFLRLLDDAGRVPQPAPRRVIRVLRPVAVAEGPARAALLPSPGLEIDIEIDYAAAAIGRQRCCAGIGDFRRALAPARTFSLLADVERMRAVGLARGGSLDNAVVIDDGRVLNPGGLRFSDEPVRHKALDALGDLALAGGLLLARFAGRRSGHRINNLLLRALFADDSAWQWSEPQAAAA